MVKICNETSRYDDDTKRQQAAVTEESGKVKFRTDCSGGDREHEIKQAEGNKDVCHTMKKEEQIHNKKEQKQEQEVETTGNGEQEEKDLESDQLRLPEANLELVASLRQLLKREFEENPQAKEIYSHAHYEHLMDPSSPNACWRYLLHRDQNVEQAFELAKDNLAWRKENRVDELRPSELVKDFWLRAPIGFLGKTRNGRDLVYAIGKNFKKPDPAVKQTIRNFITFMLFDWERRHMHDLEQLEFVFDVSDTGLRNIDLDFSKWLVSIRDCIPARIHAIYFVGMPFLIRPIIRLIISWLPERFKRVAHCGTYDQLVRANIDDDSIPEEIGGSADNKWRLAPVESPWARELDRPEASEIYEKICQACSFNTNQEYLDKVYKMQVDYENNLKAKH